MTNHKSPRGWRPKKCANCGTEFEPRSGNQKFCDNPECKPAHYRKRTERRQAEKAALEAMRDPAYAEVFSESEERTLLQTILREELQPFVREQISEETIQAIGKLYKLVPKALAVLQADLSHPDPVVRQKAVTLIMRYSMSDSLLPKQEDTSPQMHVHVPASLQVPAPEAIDSTVAEDSDVHVLGQRQCEQCGEHKPADQFEGNARRCQRCVDSFRRETLEQVLGS